MFSFRVKSRKLKIGNRRRSAYKSVSTKRKFKFLTPERIEELRKIKLKKRSERKVKWAVNAYNEWRTARLETVEYDQDIFDCDLGDLSRVTESNLEHSLCHFVPEVTKSKGEGPYPGKTLYQLIVAIQKYLEINRIKWKLIHGDRFTDLRTVLDNVMKERCAENVGNIKKQADIISYEYEERMWQEGVLGEDSPDKLRSTVLFLLGINLALRAVDEHYQLRRSLPNSPSQLSFEENTKGVSCLVFREDTCTKTNDGGLGQMRKERKVVWVYPSKNINRCPVRLVGKYLGLCPQNYVKKSHLYLQSLKCPTPKQWYGREVVGQNKIKEVVKNLLSSAKIDGYFTNHSLRRSGGTRLFQAGVDRKLVKEVTGHRSDAVDAYQITSDEQRESLSKIIAGETSKTCENVGKVTTKDAIVPVVEASCDKCRCTCHKQNRLNVGEIVNEMVSKNMKTGKTVIKLEIEITNE